MNITTVKGRDLRPSTDQAVKIGGRWYWVVEREAEDMTYGAGS